MIKIKESSGDLVQEYGALSRKVEFVVRPVTRYIVTRYSKTETTGNSENCGEFLNVGLANRTAHALSLTELKQNPADEVYYKLYSHDYDELEYPNNGYIQVS
jgi:hypothetical protein